MLGWLVALITGADNSRAAWLRVGLGAAATVLSGAAVSEVPLIETLGVRALLVSLATGCTVLALISLMDPIARR
ncbi:hypothetical protein [Alteriqipengyuania lutimaris]|uniref:hypothetical protein n=1 Tax=Alteriqipengyuania lutimaris TaxID=1538146 RepID=UPI0017A527FF|nr:hypothetical protein [Alteriqipengyuania lutimaris]MBB3034178.1 hypothetical protein [Alteriqipengyuania lutimaris]